MLKTSVVSQTTEIISKGSGVVVLRVITDIEIKKPLTDPLEIIASCLSLQELEEYRIKLEKLPAQRRMDASEAKAIRRAFETKAKEL